jgi:hypothetical protein
VVSPVSERDLLITFVTISVAIIGLALVAGLAVRVFRAVAGI